MIVIYREPIRVVAIEIEPQIQLFVKDSGMCTRDMIAEATLTAWQDVNCPILIIYGKHDLEIPVSNSQALFRHALNSTDSLNAMVESKRVELTAIPNEANVYESIDRSKPRLMLVELVHASHNNGMMIACDGVHVRLITIFISWLFRLHIRVHCCCHLSLKRRSFFFF